MRLLILQSAGEHPENLLYRECLCLSRALGRVAPTVEATVIGPGHPQERIGDTPADAILVLENYSRKPWIDIARHPALKVFWSIDAHVAFARHAAFADAQRVHVVLQSTRAYVSRFQRPGRRVLWFPNAYPSDLVRPLPDREKVRDVGFCGSILNRRPMLDVLGKAFPDFKQETVLGDAMVSAINSYRVHWNHSYNGDINYRVFETAGCATALMTDAVDGIHELFREGEISTYVSMGQAIEQIRWWVAHPQQREASAWAAHARAVKDHSYDARALQLLEVLR